MTAGHHLYIVDLSIYLRIVGRSFRQFMLHRNILGFAAVRPWRQPACNAFH